MKPLFIVNDEKNGTKVVSENVLTNDIREAFKNNGSTNYKRCDVESLAHDVVMDNAGKAITQAEYDKMIAHYVYALQEYNNITPYRFMMDHLEAKAITC